MDRINFKALFFSTGIAFGLMAIKSIIFGQLKTFVAYQLFGSKGAYSYEDKMLVMEQTSVILFDVITSIVLIVVPCYLAAKKAKGYEITHSLLMLCILSLWVLLLVPVYTAIIFAFIGAILAFVSGHCARKFNRLA